MRPAGDYGQLPEITTAVANAAAPFQGTLLIFYADCVVK